MSETSLQVIFSKKDTTSGYSLLLEQDKVPTYQQSAKISEVAKMFGMAANGLTAYAYQRTAKQIDFDGQNIILNFPFFVWPKPISLPYELSTKKGVISPPTVIEKETEGSIIVEMSNRYEFPYEVKLIEYEWESPCYNAKGELVDYPEITVEDSFLKFSDTVFGVLRVKILKKGYQHNAIVSFLKNKQNLNKLKDWYQDQGTFSYSNVNLTVVAVYEDEDGKEQTETLSLEMDQSVEDALQFCPDGSLMVGDDCTGDLDTVENVTIYYSTCTGEILDTHRVTKKC